MNQKYYNDFLKNVRPLDALEVEYMLGKTLFETPYEELKNARVLIDADTDEVYGIGDIEYEGLIKPVVWLLCTDKVDKNPIKFLRFIKCYFEIQMSRQTVLWNWVWLGNTQHVKWLKWLGAKFYEKRKINGELFQRFQFEGKGWS